MEKKRCLTLFKLPDNGSGCMILTATGCIWPGNIKPQKSTLMKRIMKSETLAALLLIFISFQAFSQSASQLFDKDKMEYKGTKSQQAKLLLRKVALWGNIVEKEAKL